METTQEIMAQNIVKKNDFAGTVLKMVTKQFVQDLKDENLARRINPHRFNIHYVNCIIEQTEQVAKELGNKLPSKMWKKQDSGKKMYQIKMKRAIMFKAACLLYDNKLSKLRDQYNEKI